MSTLSQHLDQAIAQSQELITLAEKGDWDAFTVLEQARESIVAQINTSEVDESEVEQLRDKLKQLIECNDQLEQACLVERDAAMTQLRSIQKGAKVTKAYIDK